MSKTEDGQQKREGFDDAIDRAVRGMLDVEPPAGLRGRVIERIERPRRAGLRWTWIAAPVATAAVIILAVLAPWQPGARPVPAATSSLAKIEPAPAVPPGAPPMTSESPKTISIELPYRAAPRAEPRIVIAAALLATDANSGIDPLAPIAPITVPAVRPSSITPSEIAISPLAPIAELQVTPLSPPDRRN